MGRHYQTTRDVAYLAKSKSIGFGDKQKFQLSHLFAVNIKTLVISRLFVCKARLTLSYPKKCYCYYYFRGFMTYQTLSHSAHPTSLEVGASCCHMSMNKTSETPKRLYNLVPEELVFQTGLSNPRTFALIVY